MPDLELNASEPDDEECICPVRLTVAEALNAAFVGEIDDAVTVAALFRFAVAEGYLTFEGAGAR